MRRFPTPLPCFLLAIAPSALAADLFTSFEFTDVSGQFTLGTAPRDVTFTDGVAITVGNFDLYHSGLFSWMVFGGDTGEVTFGVPAESLCFFLRDETASVASVLTIFDRDGNVMQTFNGTDVSWTQIIVGSKAQPVGKVTLKNNGNPALSTVIDDFTYCALPPIGTIFCSPAIPNSTGQPAVIEALGSDVASENVFSLIASQLPANKFGYFLNAPGQGLVMPPGSQGNLCLSGGIGRFAKQIASSGPAGVLAITVDLSQMQRPNGPTSVMAGDTFHFQGWFRDANPNTTSNFTDGVTVRK